MSKDLDLWKCGRKKFEGPLNSKQLLCGIVEGRI